MRRAGLGQIRWQERKIITATSSPKRMAWMEWLRGRIGRREEARFMWRMAMRIKVRSAGADR
jgi:hypothetical protein